MPVGFKTTVKIIGAAGTNAVAVPTGNTLAFKGVNMTGFDSEKNNEWFRVNSRKKAELSAPGGRLDWSWRLQQHIMAKTLFNRREHITRLYKHFRTPETIPFMLKLLKQDYSDNVCKLFGKEAFKHAKFAFLDLSVLEDKLPLRTLPVSSRTIDDAIRQLAYHLHFPRQNSSEPVSLKYENFPDEVDADSFYIENTQPKVAPPQSEGLIKLHWYTHDNKSDPEAY